MRHESFPKYLLVGIGEGRDIFWRIQRAQDMAVCGMELGIVTDDGVQLSRPKVREWVHCESAAHYLARLEDGSAGNGDDVPLAWLPANSFLSVPPPAHIDGVL